MTSEEFKATKKFLEALGVKVTTEQEEDCEVVEKLKDMFGMKEKKK